MSERTLSIILALAFLVFAFLSHLYLRLKQTQAEAESETLEGEQDWLELPDFPETEEEALITDDIRRTVHGFFRQWERQAAEFSLVPASEPVAVGGTKIGGCPDLPPGFDWPRAAAPKAWRKHPLAFLGQVNLAEVAPLDLRHELPERGLLLFFYDMECMGYGSCHVHYVADAGTLKRGCFPKALGSEYRYAERRVALHPVNIPPCWPHLSKAQQKQIRELYEQATPAKRLEHDREAKQAFLMPGSIYITLRAEYRGYQDSYSEPATYLLGQPVLIQDLDEDECVEAARREHGISSEKKDWVLLFQLASIQDEENGDLIFQDVGNLYFWIRRQDLAARDFSKVCTILQSY